AVLPSIAGLPKSRQPAQALAAFGVLLMISVVGGWWWGRGQLVDSASPEGAPAASPHVVGAALPPPPPELGEGDEAEPVQAAADVPATATGNEAASESDDLSPSPRSRDALGPQGRRAGNSVARFPDLPSPTLSRLSKDERQEAQSRDESQRAAVRSRSAQP
ncbi:MAG TPA: hypothetical protein VJU61_10250, partial [Polyangiaceae bacterium]|nr:hypothetical protein [Polyangiaceae bacterium]